MKAENKQKFLGIILIMVLTLSGCNFPGRARLSIEIISPEEGQSLVLNEEARVVSFATASRGVASVELYSNGILVSTDTPPEGNPVEFTSDQAWTPIEEGNVVLSVLAKDVNGNASEPISVLVQVVPSISQVEVTPTATITPTPEGLELTQTAQAGCVNEADFIEDVTIPPNTNLSAGANFTKIWRVRNSGSCDWIGYQLIHVRGELMGGISPKPIPMVSAGSMADIIMDMTAPNTPSTYSSVWQIRSNDGIVFGTELTLTITVPEPPTETPQPTPTSSPTATNTPTSTSTPMLTHTITPLPLSVKQMGEQVSIPANENGNTTVLCPSGSIVVSGGFDSENGVRIWHSMKDGNGWRVYGRNTTSSSKTIRVYAICLYQSGGLTSQEMNQENADPNDTSQLEVDCPLDSLVTGGGWVIGATNPVEIINSSRSGNGWQIDVNNSGEDDPLINVYAICLSGVSATTAQVSVSNGEIPGGETEQLYKSCPSGSSVTGGGFATNIGVIIDNTSKVANGWGNEARNTTSSTKLFTTYAICYSP